MELSDEIRIAAPLDVVYQALNNPEILQECIPGCEDLTQTSPEIFAAKVVLKIGPVKARFTGEVTLDTSGAPAGMTLTGEGKGGAAGFAKGGADVTLTEDGAETVLAYTANVDVGGKIAQLGSRLIAGTAKKLSGTFFTRFGEIVSDQPVS
ncbi:CoxG family protein [Ruegeria halocynthiae]|uniref:CoxG family protein n=1 Tax=Ruegeria halocynthiae TaxID=985054 RepID=UPI0005650176|nr:carbon monoxide dehydrogenase subunit G [Ruegeria halocynthiae]